MKVSEINFNDHGSRDILTIECDHCGTNFERNAHSIRRSLNKGITKSYCSDNCRSLAKGTTFETSCFECSNPVIRQTADKSKSGRQFCSKSCAAKTNNRIRKENQRKAKVVKNCLHCGNELAHTQKKYCSPTCQHDAQRKIKVDKWLAGELDPLNHYGVVAFIRTHMLKEAGHKCSQCGWGETNPHTGTIPLILDHIDGDHTNNRPENLRILCPNCDSLTATYKGANRGKGRHTRTQRYHAGQSY